jgi:hypothetical protein
MKIILNINKIIKDCAKEGRTNFFVWKDLGELKQHYSGVVDETIIDDIADGIQKNESISRNKKYSFRKDSSSLANEQGLCNLVELELLKRKEALDTFLKKPLFNCLPDSGTKAKKSKRN